MERDPLGKRALYSEAARTTAAGADETPSRSGPIGVSCPACGVVSRVGILDFVVYQLPLGFWLPGVGHRMTCPSCRRRVWAGVTLR